MSKGTMYGVVVRDKGLFLFWRIRRSDKGDVYVLFPQDSEANPHASYHANGQRHHKSTDAKFQVTQLQTPDKNFHGNENIVRTGIAAGEAQAINAEFKASEYSEALEIDHNILVATKYKNYLSVDLTDSNGTARINFAGKVIDQKTFKDTIPWIVVTLIET